MRDSYFEVLLRCALVSLILLIGAGALRVPPVAAMALASAPLIYYHLFYLRRRAANGLSQAAIDSVYYFGFLITVAALATSAVAIANSGAKDSIPTVLLQFGTGLFATGYAVLARMHLSSITRLSEQVSPEAVMDRYMKRSIELLDNVELAAVRSAELSSTILTKTAEVSSAAEKSLLETARAFDKEMKAALAIAHDSLAQIRSLVADTAFATEREQLTNSFRGTVETSLKLNKVMELLVARVGESARANDQTIEASAKLYESLHSLQANIGDLAAQDGPLVRSASSISAAGSSIAAEVVAIDEIVTHLKEIATDVANTGPSFRSMRTLGKKSSEQLEILSGITQRLDDILAGVAGKGEAVAVLVAEIEKAAQALPQLTAMTELLATGFGKAAGASSSLQQEVDKIPHQTEAIRSLTHDVTDGLKSIVESIERAAAQSHSLRANNADALKVVDGAQQLLAGAGSLQTTIGSLQEVINAFAAAVTKAQGGVLESSDALKTSFANSAARLEADVSKSAQATTLLIDRLIQVAQSIIDRTRAHQGARI